MHNKQRLIDRLPELLPGPAAWTARDMIENEKNWLLEFTPTQVQELETATEHFLSLKRDVGTITAADFPLPTLALTLANIRNTLLTGHGLSVLRGLPTQTYTSLQNATVFCGIGAHLGNARSQNAQGHILGHVRDTGASSSDSNTRIYQTAERQTFHTDSADAVGLLCLQSARTGGESLLVSAESIYNHMRKTRPDLLVLLFDPIATDRRGEVPKGCKPYLEIPVFNWFAGRLTVFYQRQYIDSAQRFPGAMRLTEKHIEALDLFDSLANDPSLHFSMQLQPGDMQFVYNHSQLHDRTGFTDWEEPGKRRHLLRLWLSLPGDRPLPDVFKERYGSIEIGNRGGIITENTVLHAPLD